MSYLQCLPKLSSIFPLSFLQHCISHPILTIPPIILTYPIFTPFKSYWMQVNILKTFLCPFISFQTQANTINTFLCPFISSLTQVNIINTPLFLCIISNTSKHRKHFPLSVRAKNIDYVCYVNKHRCILNQKLDCMYFCPYMATVWVKTALYYDLATQLYVFHVFLSLLYRLIHKLQYYDSAISTLFLVFLWLLYGWVYTQHCITIWQLSCMYFLYFYPYCMD